MPRLFLALVCMLAACGQSGDLYLPDKAAPDGAAQEQPAEKDKDDQKDERLPPPPGY